MDSKTFNSLSEAYSAIYSSDVEESYTVTNADKKGNTPAYQAYKAGKKKKDGTPMYKAADHMKEGDPRDEASMKKFQELQRNVDQKKKLNIRGNDSAEQKKRLEKKRGMKLDDHPQFKKEEAEVEEGYKGKHGQTDKQYADSRSQGGKMVSGDSKMSGAEYTHGRRVKAANPGMQPDVGGKTKPKSQGKMDKGTRADLEYRKANLKKEELEASGLFTEEEINAILEADEQFDEAMSSYDRNRKRAAQRAADRNAARAAGKTGVVPGVGYVSPRKERETYTDEKGTTRHKSGAKMP